MSEDAFWNTVDHVIEHEESVVPTAGEHAFGSWVLRPSAFIAGVYLIYLYINFFSAAESNKIRILSFCFTPCLAFVPLFLFGLGSSMISTEKLRISTSKGTIEKSTIIHGEVKEEESYPLDGIQRVLVRENFGEEGATHHINIKGSGLRLEKWSIDLSRFQRALYKQMEGNSMDRFRLSMQKTGERFAHILNVEFDSNIQMEKVTPSFRRKYED